MWYSTETQTFSPTKHSNLKDTNHPPPSNISYQNIHDLITKTLICVLCNCDLVKENRVLDVVIYMCHLKFRNKMSLYFSYLFYEFYMLSYQKHSYTTWKRLFCCYLSRWYWSLCETLGVCTVELYWFYASCAYFTWSRTLFQNYKVKCVIMI